MVADAFFSDNNVNNSVIQTYSKQEAQLMLTNQRDAFRGQLRSPNMVPFDMLCMVSY